MPTIYRFKKGDKDMNYILRLIASLLFTVLCYLTNPIVILFFCDEEGELDGFWHYWQTWDNSCNPSDLVKILPPRLTDWYHPHYEEVYASVGELAEMGRGRWYTELHDPDFTIMERIKRYICRVYWLYRNSAYGFCFYLLGVDYDPAHEYVVFGGDNERWAQDLDDESIWTYSNSKRIFWRLYWNIYLGYKLAIGADRKTRCMIANRIAFKIK